MAALRERIAEATRARTELLDLVRGFTPAQAAFKASPAEWSIAENVEHLVVAEQGSINRVSSAAEAVRVGRPVWSGEPVHRGRSIEEIVKLTWVAGQEAPEIARPRRGGPLSYWIVALECNQWLVRRLPPRAASRADRIGHSRGRVSAVLSRAVADAPVSTIATCST